MQQPELRYQMLAENASDVVMLVAPDLTCLWASPSVTSVLGWQPDQLVGRNPQDFVHPDGLARFAAAHEEVAEGPVVLDEMQVRCADGSYRWMSGRSRSVLIGENEVGEVVSMRDVHQQVLARKALEESEARYRTSESRYRLLAEYASDVVCLSGPDRRLQWVSPTVLPTLGWSPEELVGTMLSELIHPDDVGDIDESRDLLSAPHQDPATITYLLRARTKDGRYRWMAGRATTETDADGNLLSVVSGLHDVNELVTMREEAERNAELVRVVLDASRDGMMRFDRDAVVQYVNNEIARLTGRAAETWKGHRLRDMGYGDQEAAELEAHVLQVFNEGNSHTWLVETDTADGTRCYEAILAPVRAADGSVTEVLATSRDVTVRERAERQLMARASHDPLTGLANRPMLQSELSRALAATRRSGRPTAVLMIDLDHFKTVNDSLGHSEGDAVLVAAAHRLESSVRGGDLVARLGGDEFVIVMRDLDDPAGAMALANRIVHRFREPLTTDAAVALTTVSIGVALATAEMDDGTLLRDADRALYAAKDAGRDKAVRFEPSLSDHS